jgi:ABC-2 type transport system permease protein
MGIVLANIIAIYRKELQSYFVSPLALAVAGVFWIISGLVFLLFLFGPTGILAQIAVRQQMQVTDPLDVPYQFLQFFYGDFFGSLSLFFLPMLSMGLYAEERKRGTLELLATSPITNWAVATGKLLGVVTFYLAMIAPFLLYEALLFRSADPPMSPAMPLLCHLGLILLAASVLSLGMFVSSLTDSTILAAILTFVLIFLLLMFNGVASSLTGTWGTMLGHLSLFKHYTNLVQGAIDSSSLILFASYILLGIFLTAQSIEALRFQRS